jgi:hypothetical protein
MIQSFRLGGLDSLWVEFRSDRACKVAVVRGSQGVDEAKPYSRNAST